MCVRGGGDWPSSLCVCVCVEEVGGGSGCGRLVKNPTHYLPLSLCLSVCV